MAQVKSGLNDGAGFQPSDTVTQSNLNNHINSAQVVNIANADIASNAGIVVSKLQSVAGNSLIFNATSGSAVPTEQPIVIPGGDTPSNVLGLLYDDDTFSQADTSNGQVRGATQQSIKAFVTANAVGVSQTWQNMMGSRSNNVAYRNTTGGPIQVCLSYTSNGSTTQAIQVSSDDTTYITLATIGHDPSESGTTFTIPDDHYYKSVGSLTIRTWAELR